MIVYVVGVRCWTEMENKFRPNPEPLVPFMSSDPDHTGIIFDRGCADIWSVRSDRSHTDRRFLLITT